MYIVSKKILKLLINIKLIYKPSKPPVKKGLFKFPKQKTKKNKKTLKPPSKKGLFKSFPKNTFNNI